MEPIFQTLFIQRYAFPEAPPAHIRRLLLDAGYKYTGMFWERTVGTASTLSQSEMLHFLKGDIQSNRHSDIAPSNVVL